jgi:hypothetical protein
VHNGSVAETRTIAIVTLVIAAVIGSIAVGGALGVGVVFVLATAGRMVDGQPWFVARDRDARATVIAGGAIAGGLALGAALWISGPLGDAVGRGVEWSTLPVVRGSIVQALTVAVVIVAVAFAAELGLRRWLLELVAGALVRAGSSRGLAAAGGVVAAAVLEAAIMPLDGDAAGVAVTAVGLGVIYLAAGRRIGAPLAARLVFEVGAVTLQALRLVG